MHEIWKSVVGYEGFYEVSNKGRFRSVDRTLIQGGRWGNRTMKYKGEDIKGWKMQGYSYVCLRKPNTPARTTAIHYLVLEAFVGPKPSPTHECCHGDGNPDNNELTNLRWDTRSANQMDSVRHGTKPQGTAHYRAKLKPEDIPDIRKRIASGESLSSIGKLYKVATIAISCIRDGITWKHVT